MSKSFLIIGLGRFGRHIASTLYDMNMEVMAVDRDPEKVEAVLNFVTNGQVGDGTNIEFLTSLGVRNFDVCIVAIGDNFLASLETTFNLKELGASKVVARASRDTQRKFLLRNGADHVVYPEREMGDWTAVRFSSKNIFDYTHLEGDYGIFEVKVPQKWIGKTIGEIDVRQKYGMNIIGVKTNNKMDVMTGANYTLTNNQTLVVLSTAKLVMKLDKLYN